MVFLHRTCILSVADRLLRVLAEQMRNRLDMYSGSALVSRRVDRKYGADRYQRLICSIFGGSFETSGGLKIRDTKLPRKLPCTVLFARSALLTLVISGTTGFLAAVPCIIVRRR